MNNLTLIKNGFIQNPDSPKIKANIAIHNNKIVEVSPSEDFKTAENFDNINYIDTNGLTITPGLIDQHIHGSFGINFNTATTEEIIYFAEKITEHGITSFVATIMTDSVENIQHQISEISRAMAKQPKNAANILGIHLEGPFLNPEYKGIHPDDVILEPTIANLEKFNIENIKIVSYAPELDKNFEFTQYLKQKNIIPSAGHSKASHDEINSAQKQGLKQVTHLFNAMPPLHHRNPGILGESLVNDGLYTEVIADNEHIHPLIIDLILKIKPKDKIIFVSDCLPLSHSHDDYIIFGGHKVYKRDNKAVNEHGTFAGSLSLLDEVLRKNINKISFSDFLMFSSLNPAKNLGLSSKGHIAKGYDADLVIWNEDFSVKKAIIGGIIHNF